MALGLAVDGVLQPLDELLEVRDSRLHGAQSPGVGIT